MKNGFTLIELLVVMVILGILAAVAIPKFLNAKDKAYVSQMESDLRNLTSSQELYHADNSVYAGSVAALDVLPSQDVTITIVQADALGWSAVTTHTGTLRNCAVYYGNANLVNPATTPGVVNCDP